MIVRIWRTGVRPERLDEYRTFARDRSVPMFRRQPGCRGVVFAAAGPADHAVITFWEDAPAVAALDRSPSYQETAAALTASGILRGEQTVEAFEAEIGFLDLAAHQPAVRSAPGPEHGEA